MIDIKELLEQTQKYLISLSVSTESEQRQFLLDEALTDYQQIKTSLENATWNDWLVYLLCKKIARIAELENMRFRTIPLERKIDHVRALVPSVSEHVLRKGVTNYHEGWCKK